MKKILIYGMICLFICSLLNACSTKKEEDASNKGPIKKMTEHTAQEMVQKIQTPIDRAHQVKETQEDQAKKMDEALQEKE
jgi:hypothetical protein